MKKSIRSILLLLSLLPTVATAQEKITDRLQQEVWSQGSVTIHQPQALYELLGSLYDPDRQAQTKGYRIQVYAGTNTRAARDEASKAASTARHSFPDLPIYTEFIAPRWVCRVGDYKTYEEADAQLREFKKQGLFRDATILPNQIINITY